MLKVKYKQMRKTTRSYYYYPFTSIFSIHVILTFLGENFDHLFTDTTRILVAFLILLSILLILNQFSVKYQFDFKTESIIHFFVSWLIWIFGQLKYFFSFEIEKTTRFKMEMNTAMTIIL